MYEYNRCKWKNNYLYYGTRKTGISVIEFGTDGMWKISFENGDLSKDYYNLTRVKENARNLYVDEKNEKEGKTLEGAKKRRG